MAGPWEDFAAPPVDTKPPWEDWGGGPVMEKAKTKPSTVLERVGTGAMDPIHGGAQLLTHALPDSVVKSINELNNWLASKGAPLATVPAGGVDEMTRQREGEYQAQRSAAGSEGIDFARLGGNVLSPVNMGIARLIPGGAAAARALTPAAVTAIAPRAAGFAADVAGNVVGGAAMGATAPVTEGDFAGEKALQMGIGAAAGGASPFVTRGASRIINAPDSAQARMLAEKGVIMTPGQLLGGAFKSLEDASTSVPIIGNIVQAAKNESMKSFNKAAVNDALKHIGLKVPAGTEPGHSTIAFAASKISDAYDSVLARSYGELDDGLRSEMEKLIANVNRSHMDPAVKETVARRLQGEVFDRFSAGGRVAGETIKDMQSELRQMFRDSLVSNDSDARHAGAAYREADAAVTRMLQRVNPETSAELKNVDAAYASFLRPLVAAAKSGAHEGIFTPSQLKQASIRLDSSKWKKQSATGTALGRELADAGEAVLPSSMPESGTTIRRNWFDAAKLSTGVAGALPATLMYNDPAMWLLSQAARVQGTPGANALAARIGQKSNLLTPALVSGTNALVQP